MYAKLLKLTLILFLVFVPLKGKAQNPISMGFSVGPQIFELDVFPGETINEEVRIKNKSEVAVPIEVRVVNFTAEEETGNMLFDQSLQDPAIASYKWFKIENPNFILDPQEAEKISFNIEVPEEAVPGGHYVTMLFEPRLPSFYFEEGQPRAIPVVGVLFLLSVKTFSLEPEEGNKIEIVEFSVPREERMVGLENIISKLVGGVARATFDISIVEKSPSKFILRIKNNDIYHQRPQGELVIYNSLGKKIGETQIPKMTILPGKTRQFPVNFSTDASEKLKWLPGPIYNFLVKDVSMGKYRAAMVLEIPDQRLELESYFWGFSWKLTLPFFFLLIGAVLMRKRIVAATKVLIGIKK